LPSIEFGVDDGCGKLLNALSAPVGGIIEGIDPVLSGGKGPAGSCGVTRLPPLLTRPLGAERGAGAIEDVSGTVTTEPKVPLLPSAVGAMQLTAPPPSVPEQLHVHGPRPLTALVIPAEHNPPRGGVKVGMPLAGPHDPVIAAGGCNGAVQLTLMPPFDPTQFQFHGPSPAVPVAVPVAHKSSIG
jgi:hypothetical protein